jgi:hypothetical protein
MTTLERSLELLEFKSLEDVTADVLKSSFKRIALTAHPDKGGDYVFFDEILSAYVHLSKVLKRLSGGRDQIQSCIAVEDVKEARESQFTNELNNLVNEVFDELQQTSDNSFSKKFNEEFEKYRKQEKENGIQYMEHEKGYEEWFRDKDEKNNNDESYNVEYTWSSDTKTNPVLETKKTPPIFAENDLNKIFEYSVKCGKGEPTELILHPDEMAVQARSMGTQLIVKDNSGFTSGPYDNPEYTDLYSAYTSDNTYFDKLPSYKEKERTFEDLLKEREITYKTELDRDLEAIAAYELKKQKDDKEHKQKVADYFKNTTSSKWALKGSTSTSDSFIKEI